MTKKKKSKGPNNPSSIEQQSLSQSQPVPPSHENQSPQSCPARLWHYAKIAGKILLKVARGTLEASAILGILAFYVQFSPNVSVTPHTGFAGSDPFITPFVISNNSYMNFRKVRTSCLLFNVKLKGIKIEDSKVSSVEGEAALVASGESLTVRCELEQVFKAVNVPRGDLISADIKIDVTFEIFPYQYFRKEERTFRFVAAKADDSHWHWLPQPIGKP